MIIAKSIQKNFFISKTTLSKKELQVSSFFLFCLKGDKRCQYLQKYITSGCGHGEKSQKLKDCIESWKRCMPECEIIEWNEDNFDIDLCKFTRDSYDKKMYAFTSDVIRLWALYNYGGYYLDTDVYMYKSLRDFENEEGFTGFEDVKYPATATMGAEKGNPVIKMMLDAYMIRDFYIYPVWTDYIKYEETSTCIYSDILAALGIDRMTNKLQRIPHFAVYPTSYFFTKGEGYTWHSFTGSWS